MAGLAVEESADRWHFEALIGDRTDKEGYRGILPLVDRLPFATTGVTARPWYRPEDTVTRALAASYERYACMEAPPRFDAGIEGNALAVTTEAVPQAR